MKLSAELKYKTKSIRCLALDVDGVLTDGRLYRSDNGEEFKAFHSRDGHGIRMAQQLGLEFAIISGRQSPATAARAQELGIMHLWLGIADKSVALQQLLQRLTLQTKQVAYLGDDVIDLPVMHQVGLACAVSDADPRIKKYADYVTTATGGNGAVREVCELILSGRDLLELALRPFMPETSTP